MTVVKWYPREVSSFEKQVDRLFGDFFGSAQGVRYEGWQPPVDVHETESAFVLTAELPGLDRKQIAIEVEKNVLSISGEKAAPAGGDAESRHRVERRYGKFSRSFRLPSTVDAKAISASSVNGVLRVIVPKKEEVRPRAIKIEVDNE